LNSKRIPGLLGACKGVRVADNRSRRCAAEDAQQKMRSSMQDRRALRARMNHGMKR